MFPPKYRAHFRGSAKTIVLFLTIYVHVSLWEDMTTLCNQKRTCNCFSKREIIVTAASNPKCCFCFFGVLELQHCQIDGRKKQILLSVCSHHLSVQLQYIDFSTFCLECLFLSFWSGFIMRKVKCICSCEMLYIITVISITETYLNFHSKK